METIRYKTQNGYIYLNEKGNTYVGTDAQKVMYTFIHNNINTYDQQKEVLDFAVRHNKLIVD